MKIRTMTREELHALYGRCLRRDFPADELRPLWGMDLLLEQGTYLPLLAEDAGSMQAYALLAITDDAALLDYYAVEPQLRGSGVGTAFLQALRKRDLGAPYLLIEAESLRSAQTPAQTAEREGRIRFYRHCGCAETGVRSTLFGVEYDILALPLKDPAAPGDEEVTAALHRLYRVIISPLVERDSEAFSRVCRVYPRE